MATNNYLSVRGRKYQSFINPMQSYGLKLIGTNYHPEKNPEGILNLGVAESTLCEDLVLSKLRSMDLNTLQAEHVYYSDVTGMPPFKEVVAKFLETKFKAAKSINPDNLIVTSGVGTALEHLACMLCDPGDYCLIHTPYYVVLSTDIGVRAGVLIAYAPTVIMEEDGISEFRIDIKKTEEAIKSYTDEGKKIKMAIVVNPSNPTGQVLTRQELLELLILYNKYKLHVVLDEVYALSMLGDTSFTSVLSIADLPNPHMVHFVWGFSKDFGLSGFRCGIIHSLIPNFIDDSTCPFTLCNVPPLMQLFLTDIITDEKWMEATYFPENKLKREASYKYLYSALLKLGAKPHISKAAHFVWANLSKLLKTPSVESEMQLFEAFLSAGVYCVPGNFLQCQQPGWFRFTFTHPKQYLDIGIRRLTQAIERFTASNEKENQP